MDECFAVKHLLDQDENQNFHGLSRLMIFCYDNEEYLLNRTNPRNPVIQVETGLLRPKIGTFPH